MRHFVQDDDFLTSLDMTQSFSLGGLIKVINLQ